MSLSIKVSLPSQLCFCTSFPLSRVTTVCRTETYQIKVNPADSRSFLIADTNRGLPVVCSGLLERLVEFELDLSGLEGALRLHADVSLLIQAQDEVGFGSIPHLAGRESHTCIAGMEIKATFKNHKIKLSNWCSLRIQATLKKKKSLQNSVKNIYGLIQRFKSLTESFHVFIKVLTGNHFPCSNKLLNHLDRGLFQRCAPDSVPSSLWAELITSRGLRAFKGPELSVMRCGNQSQRVTSYRGLDPACLLLTSINNTIREEDND